MQLVLATGPRGACSEKVGLHDCRAATGRQYVWWSAEYGQQVDAASARLYCTTFAADATHLEVSVAASKHLQWLLLTQMSVFKVGAAYLFVPAIDCRFLWQLQYMVSQGFYVILDFSSSRDREPNLERAELLAQNWGNLWRMLTELPAYTQHLAGRLFPDLVNEPRCVH